MDKVLNVERLSVLDLLDPSEINKRASIPPPGDDEFQNVLMVEASIAATEPLLISMNVKEIIKFKKNFLRKLRPALESDRDQWERFVAIQIDAREGMSMYPRLLPGATVLIDRHYNSLRPYRKGESNMYAVNKNEGCTVRYVEVAGKHLVLRPHNNAYPVEVMPIQHGKKPPDSPFGQSAAFEPSHNPRHRRRFNLFSRRELAQCDRPTKNQHRKRGKPGRRFPRRNILLSHLAQQVDSR